MRCYNHGELEAVGICVACGKALCADCAISFDDIIHCKRCLEAGRFSEETRWQAKLMTSKASPRGTPKDVFFKIGAAGSALGIIVPILSIFSTASVMLMAMVFALMGVVLAIQSSASGTADILSMVDPQILQQLAEAGIDQQAFAEFAGTGGMVMVGSVCCLASLAIGAGRKLGENQNRFRCQHL